MVVSGKKKTEKLIIVNCDCGCNEEIHITRYTDMGLPNDYYISILEGKFYSLQEGILYKIGHRLKHIWYAIIGKEYTLCEICLTEEDIDTLIEKLKEIKK